jgi:Mitochondrial ribosomal subunit protein
MGMGRSSAPPSPPDLSFLHRSRGSAGSSTAELDTSTAIAIATELLDIAEEDPPPPPKREPSAESPYESPMQSFFDDMYNNGPTTLGTTDEILQYEESVSKQQKVMSCGIPESKLRFTTTSWGRTMMAPFIQNNEHRVICKLNLDDLPFAKGSPECDILQQIVGPRLNYDRNELRLTCNQFGSRIENKRHLVSMMDRIISSCQRLGAALPPSDAGVLEEPTTPSSTTTTTTM